MLSKRPVLKLVTILMLSARGQPRIFVASWVTAIFSSWRVTPHRSLACEWARHWQPPSAVHMWSAENAIFRVFQPHCEPKISQHNGCLSYGHCIHWQVSVAEHSPSLLKSTIQRSRRELNLSIWQPGGQRHCPSILPWATGLMCRILGHFVECFWEHHLYNNWDSQICLSGPIMFPRRNFVIPCQQEYTNECFHLHNWYIETHLIFLLSVAVHFMHKAPHTSQTLFQII